MRCESSLHIRPGEGDNDKVQRCWSPFTPRGLCIFPMNQARATVIQHLHSFTCEIKQFRMYKQGQNQKSRCKLSVRLNFNL
jgi:hypothetical protein